MTQARVRYEPEEAAPPHVALGAALQAIAAMVMTTTLIPTVIGHHARLPEAHIQWMLFASLIAASIIAAVQTLRFGRIGSGLVMLGGAAPAFIGVSGLALSHGGIPLLSVLSLCSLPMVLLFARQAHRFRRVLRAPVMGTLLMLVAASLAQAVWRIALAPPPTGEDPWINLAITAITFASILLIAILARSTLRYLAPIGGLLLGYAVAWGLGAIPADSVGREALLGVPAYPVDYAEFELGYMFFALLPAFLVLQVVTSMESFSCSRLSQSLSYRKPGKPDQRIGQGAVLANGMGTLAAAALGALPTTTYSSSVSILGMTGIMSRRVGYWAAAILLAVAFSPQIISFIVHFPAPVAAGYLLFIVVLIFNNGVRMATEEGLDAQEGVIVFTGFWTGITLQTGLAGAHLGELGAVLSSSGTAIGGILTLLMILLMDLRMGEKTRIAFMPSPEGFAELNGAVSRHARRMAPGPNSLTRLMLCCEEATQVIIALRQANPAPSQDGRISLSLRAGAGSCQVELMTLSAEGDFAVMEKRARQDANAVPINERIELASLRILTSLASDIRHGRYHDVDILSFTVPMKASENADDP
jgi:xanthine permease XanP